MILIDLSFFANSLNGNQNNDFKSKTLFFSEEMLQEQPFLGVLGEKYF